MLHDLNSIQISKDKTIMEAMRAINDSASRFALVVDNEKRLIGIVTDGDIRRGFLDKHDPNEPVVNIMNDKPIVAREGLTHEAMLELINDKFAQIPVLDDQGRVKGVLTFKDKNVLLDAKSRRVCILGLGFVGLTISVVLAELGFTVYGYDINTELIENLKAGKVPFHEDGLEGYLNRYVGTNLLPVTSLEGCDIDTFVITVGTPVDPLTKLPNMNYIEQAVRSIGAYLKPDDLVILRSTVPVGTTRGVVVPILDEMSGLEVGADYYLAYVPERTIAGRAIPELKELPQIIGGFDKKSTMVADRFFREVTPTIVDVGSLEGAEMVKILNNTFRDVKFGYANEMAMICKELGLDMVKLAQAANLGYSRDEIPLPSPGVGGACLTKDPYILMYSCKDLKHKPGIVKEARRVNESVPRKIAEEIRVDFKSVNKDEKKVKIFIAGFAFKGEPETSDLRGSTTLDLLRYLREEGFEDTSFYGHDPVIADSELAALGVTPVSVHEGFKQADAVILMNNHKSYEKMDIFELLSLSRKDCVFVDGWHVFDHYEVRTVNSVRYRGVGCND